MKTRQIQSWLVGRLFHCNPESFPELTDFIGERESPKREEINPEENRANVRAWKIYLDAMAEQ